MHAYFPALNSYPSLLGVRLGTEREHLIVAVVFFFRGHVGKRFKSIRIYLGKQTRRARRTFFERENTTGR